MDPKLPPELPPELPPDDPADADEPAELSDPVEPAELFWMPQADSAKSPKTITDRNIIRITPTVCETWLDKSKDQ